MAKLLRGHSRPISQNLIAAAIYDFGRSGVPTLVTWFAAYKTSLTPGWTTPWVILLGAVVFLVLSVAMRLLLSLNQSSEPAVSGHTTDQKESCPDKSLHANADHDQNHINEAVSVESCLPRCSLQPPSPYIDFTFTVFNGSVYRVSVSNPVEGNILFRDHPLSGRVQIERNAVNNLERHAKATFCIRQWLSIEEAEMISETACNVPFLFLALQVPLTGGDYYKGVIPRTLKLVRGVYRNGSRLCE